MTLEAHQPRSRAPSSRGRAVLAAGALAVALSAGGGTHALWSDQDAAGHGPAAVLRAGHLDVALGRAAWSETSPDVVGTPRSIDPATFLAMPGDTVVLRQNFATTLTGDNITAELSVRWSRGADVPEGVSATYRIHGDATAPTDPVPVGQRVVLPQLPAGERPWNVQVTFALDPGSHVHYAEDPIPARLTTLADLGDMEIELRQVRSGAGYLP